jgi:two-component system sensor histidine kinase/response regulator
VGELQQIDDQHDPLAAELEEFMAVAAHDLRNPIAVIRASAQMAQRQIARGDPDGAQVRLKAIVEQTDRLTEMLETFLDAARITTGRLVLRPEQVELRTMVESAADRARLLVSEHRERSLECRVPEGCIGAWDKAKIGRAVRAMLSNALVYGDPAAPVRVDARRDDGRVCMTVSGGGPGPDAEEAGHLFEQFYRGPSAAEAGQSGSGLGLYTARGIARSHGGDVRWVDGDRFEIELPLTE